MVLSGDLPDAVGVIAVVPSRLAVAHAPLGRDVAAADDASEFPGRLQGLAGTVGAGKEVEVKVDRRTGDDQLVLVGVADVEPADAGVVEEEGDVAAAVRTVDDEEVVGGVKVILALGVHHVVEVVAEVEPAPLVDAPLGFAEAVDDVAVLKVDRKLPGVLPRLLHGRAPALGAVGLGVGVDDGGGHAGEGGGVARLVSGGDRLRDNDRFGVEDRGAEPVFGNHKASSFLFDFQKFIDKLTTIIITDCPDLSRHFLRFGGMKFVF